jgi:hypothetical protein
VLSLLPSTAELLIRKCGNGLRVELGLLLSLRELLLLLLEHGCVECGGTHGVLRETIGHIWGRYVAVGKDEWWEWMRRVL